jgi:hypothetical protein
MQDERGEIPIDYAGELPKLWELAEAKLKCAGQRDKTITIKITINTARMMVARERQP